MTRALTATALLSIALLAPVRGTSTGAASDPPLQIADLAWERGDYPAALAGYLRLLDSPDAASVLEPIALRTGELYASTELTRDGALPQFSPDGRYLLYETGPVATRVTRVIATAAPDRVVVELRGGGAAFSPDGREGRLLEADGAGARPPAAGTTARQQVRARARDDPRSRHGSGDLARYRHVERGDAGDRRRRHRDLRRRSGDARPDPDPRRRQRHARSRRSRPIRPRSSSAPSTRRARR